MSDTGERPTKMRKLNPQAEPSETAQNDEPISEPAHEIEGEKAHEYKETAADDLASTVIQDKVRKDLQLSKSQLKKLRRQEQWEAGKEYRKTKRREKDKAKKARKAEERVDLEAKIAKGEVSAREPPKRTGSGRPVQLPVTFILDCEFEDFMNEKELVSLGAQITRCYSENKSRPYRSHMVISSWNGKLRERFETILYNHHLGWKGVRFVKGDFMVAAGEMEEVLRGPTGGRMAGAFAPPEIPGASQSAASENNNANALNLLEPNSKPSVIYLTSDSPNTLDRLSPNTSYIIGGIVDKNRHKGLCYKRAYEHGVQTAKLPIGKYMTMQGRSVLAVNHVMEIMLHWLESGDWGDAFLKVIPKRKEARLKATSKQNNAEDSEGTTDEHENTMEQTGDGRRVAEQNKGLARENEEEKAAIAVERLEAKTGGRSGENSTDIKVDFVGPGLQTGD